MGHLDRKEFSKMIIFASLFTVISFVIFFLIFGNKPTQEGSQINTEVPTLTYETCSEKPYTAQQVVIGNHTAKQWYDDGDSPPAVDLLHRISEGFIIIKYRSTLNSVSLAELKKWVLTNDYGVIAVSGGGELPVALGAVTINRALNCPALDMGTINDLSKFRDSWFNPEPEHSK